MSKEIVKTETNLPADPLSKGTKVLKSDVVLPKVLLMQGLSDLVNERKAQQGDFVRSSTAEKLGDDKAPLEFIPLTFQNLWLVSEDQKGDGKKYEFRRYEPRTAANESADWDYLENGTKWRRTKIMSLFALLPKDIESQAKMMKEFEETGEMPDVDKVLLPVVIQFKNTSFKAGKEVATLFAKAESVSRQLGTTIPAYGTTMRLSCVSDKNDKGSFFVMKVESIGKTKPEYKEAAANWYAQLMQLGAAIKVDESDMAAAEEVAAEPTNF